MAKPYTSPDLLPALRRGDKYRHLRGTGLIVVDDRSELQLAIASHGTTGGHLARDWSEQPLGYRGMSVFDAPKVPFDEIYDRVKEDDEKGRTNRALAEQLGQSPLDQWRTSLCWAFGPTMVMRYRLALSGFPVDLSPMGPACWINNWKDHGGFATEFVEATEDYGITTIKEHPLYEFSRKKYDKDAIHEAAARRKCREYFDLRSKGLSVKQKMQTAYTVLRKVGPYTSGHDWMSHQVAPWDIVIVDDQLCYYCWNSGLYRNAKGITIFSMSKGAYDDAIVPTVLRLAP